MDLTLADETTATTAAAFASSPSSSEQQSTETAEAASNPVSATMDFFFHGALDQLQGATELDVQLNPLLMNRVSQLCLTKISIASSGRESLRRVAQLSCFWRRLQSDMFFMPLQTTPQSTTSTSFDPNNMFATPTTEPFATWNWLQDTTCGLDLDYFNLGNEAAAGNTGYTTLLSDPNDASLVPSTVTSSTSLSPAQSLSSTSSSSEFALNAYTSNSSNGGNMDHPSTSGTTAGSIMAYTDLPDCNGSISSGVQSCLPIASCAALSVSDAFTFQLAFQSQSATPISGTVGNTSSLSSSPFTLSTATEGSHSERNESFLQGPKDIVQQATTTSQLNPLRQSHETSSLMIENFSMSNDISSQEEMGSTSEKSEMDVDSHNHSHNHSHHESDNGGSGIHPMVASSGQVSSHHDHDVSDMDVDRAIQEMALHSAPSSPSKRHPYDTRQQRTSAHSVTSPSPEDTDTGFPSDASSPSLPASFTARLVSVLQDEDLDMEEEEMELHRIKRRRCSEDSSSSDSGPESAPTSPRTPPSNLEGSQGSVSSLPHSHGITPGLTSRRLYNLHPEGDDHESGCNTVNPFLNSPMAEYVLQDSGIMSKEQHHRFLGSPAGINSISNADTSTATTSTATAASLAGSGRMTMGDVASGGVGSVAVVVVEDLLNLNRQGEGEGQAGILATTVHTRYPTRSTTQRRVV
ncbi:hypothetical protein BGZ95_004478 [Linnemannia exigua]|uniref:Uncharacterized protein n=1 Tax=Linnemannia exigua TaxID=604196 RepID=A0AAD4D3G3_9FUNG|nr:hypothetical protein BGZ95_004478 [Linnemannia exigua]